VKPKPRKRIPALIALGGFVLVCLVRWRQVGFFERLERITYDLRVREAVKFAPPVAAKSPPSLPRVNRDFAQVVAFSLVARAQPRLK
jgi:hypothetical protein